MPHARTCFGGALTRCRHPAGVHQPLRGTVDGAPDGPYATSAAAYYSPQTCALFGYCIEHATDDYAAVRAHVAGVAGVIYGKKLSRDAVCSRLLHDIFNHGEHRVLAPTDPCSIR